MLQLMLDNKYPEYSDNFAEIFLTGIKYTELTFPEGIEREALKSTFKELFDKITKIINLKHKFQEDLNILKTKLVEENQKGVDALGTQELSQHIEDFLHQGSSALDIFSTNTLKQLIGYSHDKWNYKKMVEAVNDFESKETEIKKEILRMLQDDQDSWLKELLQDRHLHHEGNFQLSPLHMKEGEPFIFLTRRNGVQSSEVIEYLEIHWENLYGLIKDLIWLTFCLVNPALKTTRLSKEYFLS